MNRSVTLQLNAVGNSANGKVFDDLGKRAQAAASDSSRLHKSITDLLGTIRKGQEDAKHIDRISQSLRHMGVEAEAAGKAATQLVKDIGDGARVSLAQIQRLGDGLKALGQTQGSSWQQLQGGLAQLGQGSLAQQALAQGQAGLMARLPTSKLGLATAALGAVGHADDYWLGLHERSIQQEGGPAYGLTADESRRRTRYIAGDIEQAAQQYIPGGKTYTTALRGLLPGYDNFMREPEEQSRRIQEQRTLNARAEVRVGFRGQVREREEALQREMDRASDYGRIVPAAQKQQYAVSHMFEQGRSVAMDQARRDLRDPSRVEARYRFQEGMASQAVGQQAEMQMVDLDRGRAELKVSSKHQEVADSLTAEAALRRNINAEGLTAEQRTERRLQLERQMIGTQQAQAELQKAQADLLEIQKQKQSVIMQQSEQRRSLLENERARLNGVVEMEKERIRGARQGFGGMWRHEQREAVRVAEKAARGGVLNPMEMQMLQRTQGAERLAGQQLERRADSGLFNRLNKATGLDRELKDAQAGNLTINNKIEAELKMNAESVAEQLRSTLLPQIMSIMTQVGEAMKTALQRDALQQQDQMKVLGGN